MDAKNKAFDKKRAWLMGLLEKRKYTEEPTNANKKVSAPLVACPACKAMSTAREWHKNLCVCPRCGAHQGISAYERLHTLMDRSTFAELPSPDVHKDPLSFPGYAEKKQKLNNKTGLCDACVCAVGRVGGYRVVLAVLDARFLMGSMGGYVGEAVTQAVEFAQQKSLPLVIFSASGGARMQEGIFSLMQMAKTSAALERFAQSGGLYISCLTHPTTGGVSASFASLGDITLAEPGALIGFAGPRVIEQTIRQKLPEGFQRAEYLLEHGFVDCVLPRKDMRKTLIRLLKLHTKGEMSLAARAGTRNRSHHSGVVSLAGQARIGGSKAARKAAGKNQG